MTTGPCMEGAVKAPRASSVGHTLDPHMVRHRHCLIHAHVSALANAKRLLLAKGKELWIIMRNDGELWGIVGNQWGIMGKCGELWGFMGNY